LTHLDNWEMYGSIDFNERRHLARLVGGRESRSGSAQRENRGDRGGFDVDHFVRKGVRLVVLVVLRKRKGGRKDPVKTSSAGD